MGLENGVVKMKRNEEGGWEKVIPSPSLDLFTDAGFAAWRAWYGETREAREAEMKQAEQDFAPLPKGFNDGGYLRGKSWYGVVRNASGKYLSADLLTPDEARHIADSLERFDWEPQIARSRKWAEDILEKGHALYYGETVEEYEQHYRTVLIPGLIGYFRTCAEKNYGIAACS